MSSDESRLAVYQDMEHCNQCAGPRIFLPVFEFDGGRVGYCLGCGRWRVIYFTRTVEAVAA